MGKLKDRQISSLAAGRHADGENLYLEVAESGRRTWLLRFQLQGRRHDMGLGPYPAVGLQEARERAQEARRQVRQGVNPIEARRASKRSGDTLPTFSEIARETIAEAQAKSSNLKVKYQWERHLGPAYCGPLLPRPVHEITTLDVAAVLKPVWKIKPEVARKLLPALRRVFDHARVVLRDRHGYAMGPNPANWADLKAIGLVAPERLTRGRHPSLPHPMAQQFFGNLKNVDAISGIGLRLLLLTNVRTNSLIEAKWEEVDWHQKIWLIPRKNLKDGKYRSEGFRVPLSDQAIELLTELNGQRTSEFILPGARNEKPCSNGIFLALIKRMYADEPKWVDPRVNKCITPHGFRATFRTWAEEETDTPREVIEEAMGHQIGNSVERAYRQTDILEKRRKLMQKWGDFLSNA